MGPRNIYYMGMQISPQEDAPSRGTYGTCPAADMLKVTHKGAACSLLAIINVTTC